MGASSLFVPDPESSWWPSDLGSPGAVGSQNSVRYAYFPDQRRLAVKTGGDVWIYDTLDHQIGGFSQQQGSGGSITFTSQYGTVNLSSLPVVSQNGRAAQQPAQVSSPSSYSTANNSGQSSQSSDIMTLLERLGDLKAKGILSDEEFSSKKAELLGRL